MPEIRIERASSMMASSFAEAVDTVAKERKYLAGTRGFPVASCISFVEMIVSNNYAQYYAVDSDHVVGWCDIVPKQFEGMRHVGVLGMGVLKEYRGQGIGRRLLECALEHARKYNGVEKVELEVFKSNTPAIALYEKLGFKYEGERIRARKLDGQYDNIVLMGKEL